ncbi:hypothetical protein EK21DRAFT_77280, partial [Setomelanomma holmii]
IPHIKLKAEHQALLLFHIVKYALTYWEGWRDGKKTRMDEDGDVMEGMRERTTTGRGRAIK